MFIYELLPTELKRNSFRHTDYGSQHMHTHIVSYVPLIVSNIYTFMGTLGTCEHIQWICTEETVGAKLDVCEKAHIVWARERTFTHIHIHALTHTTVSFELDWVRELKRKKERGKDKRGDSNNGIIPFSSWPFGNISMIIFRTVIKSILPTNEYDIEKFRYSGY